MSNELLVLTSTAAFIGFSHTIIGPDHYLPFIFLSKARSWTLWKTIWVTAICGLGHVGSTILIGSAGIIFGRSFENLEIIRGGLAAWGFIIFGSAYLIWGIWRAIKNKPHKHMHVHDDGSLHSHDHDHADDHSHVHNTKLTPWALFIIFVLGPCEPLFAYFTLSSSDLNNMELINMAIIFSLVTILTMIAIVVISFLGFKVLPTQKLERYMHVIAGGIILFSGIAIQFLGL